MRSQLLLNTSPNHHNVVGQTPTLFTSSLARTREDENVSLSVMGCCGEVCPSHPIGHTRCPSDTKEHKQQERGHNTHNRAARVWGVSQISTMLRCLFLVAFQQLVSLSVGQTIAWRADLLDATAHSLVLSPAEATVFVLGDGTMERVDTDLGEVFHVLDLPDSDPLSSMVAFVGLDGSAQTLLLSSKNHSDLMGYDPVQDEVFWTMHHAAKATNVLFDPTWGSAVYTQNDNGQIECLDASNGVPVWTSEIAWNETATLYIHRNILYAVTRQGKVRGYSAPHGTVVQSPRFETMEASFMVQHQLYFYKSNTLLVFDVHNDYAPLWATDQLPGTRLVNVWGLFIDYVLVQTDYALLLLDRNSGVGVWMYKPQNTVASVSVMPNYDIYVVESYGDDIGSVLTKVNPENGHRAWIFPSVDTIVGRVVANHDDTVYFLSKSSIGSNTTAQLVALDGTTTKDTPKFNLDSYIS